MQSVPGCSLQYEASNSAGNACTGADCEAISSTRVRVAAARPGAIDGAAMVWMRFGDVCAGSTILIKQPIIKINSSELLPWLCSTWRQGRGAHGGVKKPLLEQALKPT